MSSSEEKQMDTRDFRYVYVRRRRNAAGSGKVVRDLDLNAPPPSEPSMPKTDGSFEIGDDSVSLVLYFACFCSKYFLQHSLFFCNKSTCWFNYSSL